MITEFIESALVHVADRFAIVDLETQETRKRICNACDHHIEPDACTSCGCGTIPVLNFIGLDLNLKRSWGSSVCPEGKW